MAQNSTIEWTNHTFNPWWGCAKVSPGCAHCYAETWASRYGFDVWGPHASRRTFGENHWREPIRWNELAQQESVRRRVFCASMADVFEDHSFVRHEREKLWALIESTPMLDWLLLTKRPENMRRFAPWGSRWPSNIWAMTSIENQAFADQRIDRLLEVPVRIRALSMEPLLGPVNLSKWIDDLDWVIVGGESGHGARPMHPAWVAQIFHECKSAQVPFFFKQWGAWSPLKFVTNPEVPAKSFMIEIGKGKAGRSLFGRTWDSLPQSPSNTKVSKRTRQPVLAV